LCVEYLSRLFRYKILLLEFFYNCTCVTDDKANAVSGAKTVASAEYNTTFVSFAATMTATASLCAKENATVYENVANLVWE
jgi:triacylglycerol esterase/lipase EstA (alpha/beta hydrolase family)